MPDLRAAHLRPDLLAVVLVGGVVGTAVRASLAQAWPTTAGHWPWATLVANLLACLIVGALVGVLPPRGVDAGRRRATRLLIGAGFCGALSTYSSLAVETDQLLRHGHAWLGIGYALTSVVIGLAAGAAAMLLGRRVPQAEGRVA